MFLAFVLNVILSASVSLDHCYHTVCCLKPPIFSSCSLASVSVLEQSSLQCTLMVICFGVKGAHDTGPTLGDQLRCCLRECVYKSGGRKWLSALTLTC